LALGATLPVDVPEFVVIIKVEVLPVVEAGLNEALAPVGRPLMDKLTVPAKFLRLMAIE
jgi:hypothetical protein